MYLTILIRQSLFHVNLECWDQAASSNSPKARGTKYKNRERNGPSQAIIKKREPHERGPYKRKPCTKKRCARRAPWDLAKKKSAISKNEEKATFYSPFEIKAAPAHISKSPEEREFVVDSGASMHVLSKKELSSEEPETLRRSRTPTVVVTAIGEVQTNEEAQVFRSRS